MTTRADLLPWKTTTEVVVLLVCAVLLRAGVWVRTGLTLEDSLITARYAENLAEGRGFVYNEGEKVLGTTTPLWTLILAATQASGISGPLPAAKVLGILFDLLSMVFLMAMLRDDSPVAALFFGAAFAASPEIVPVTVSGMETSLLIFSMALSMWALSRNSVFFGIGLALTVLTRVDGILFASLYSLWALLHQPRWALRQILLASALCLPWCIFSALSFGGILPQSLLAKRAVYHFDTLSSAAPFLQLFTPWGTSPIWKMGLKGLLSALFLTGVITALTTQRRYLPAAVFFVAYCSVFIASGGMIFAWYLLPPLVAFWIFVALGTAQALRGLGRLVARWPVFPAISLITLCLIAGGSFWMLVGRTQKYAELQRFEERVRKPIGLWLREHARPASTVLLEPIGYIGYYAGHQLIIKDEVGLVTPEMIAFRSAGPGWYGDAVEHLQPDFLVQYTFSLLHNRSEGTGVALFRDDRQRKGIDSSYARVKTFEDPSPVSWMDEKERSYTVLQRVAARTNTP